MTTETSADSVYEQTHLEHEQLRERIKFLHQRFEARPATPDEIVRLLSELRAALATHFNNEECEGFFEQIVTRAPQLSRQALKLTHEHVDMLERLDAIVRAAEIAAAESVIPAELSARFHEFSKTLMHHESEENGMLQSAYQDDLGTKD
jgi:iron-sulfur cluster repair protein YtfE (RIC family)